MKISSWYHSWFWILKSSALLPAYHYQYLERSQSIKNTYAERIRYSRGCENCECEEFTESRYHRYKDALKGFQILEGIYTFLAYLAFVNNKADFYKMSRILDEFIKDNDINTKDILQYKRFWKELSIIFAVKKKSLLRP